MTTPITGPTLFVTRDDVPIERRRTWHRAIVFPHGGGLRVIAWTEIHSITGFSEFEATWVSHYMIESLFPDDVYVRAG